MFILFIISFNYFCYYNSQAKTRATYTQIYYTSKSNTDKKKLGRKTVITKNLVKQVLTLKEVQNLSIVDIARSLNKSRNTIYKVLKNNLGYRYWGDENKTIAQSELKNIIIKPTRPNPLEMEQLDFCFDFKIEGPDPWTHAAVKHPFGSEALISRSDKKYRSLIMLSYNIGRRIISKKYKFYTKVKFGNIIHIIDLFYIPLSEKEIVKEHILKGIKRQLTHMKKIERIERMEGMGKVGKDIVFLNDT